MKDIKVTDSVKYIGVDDHDIDLFESQYVVPNGVSYNSYVILDEKVAVMDTVDACKTDEWLVNLEEALDGRNVDYIVVSHMEPDHAASLQVLAEKYPEAKVVGNAKTFNMIPQFFTFDLEGRKVVVKEGDTLSLGSHTLQFVMAPMVHWPEVMVTYDTVDKILFSADAFGSFGTVDGNIFADEVDFEHRYMDEARRYYTNIVGKYGPQVQSLLKKASGLEIKMICPLHGFVWRKDFDKFIDKYVKWSTYTPEIQSVLIPYASVYGGTQNVVEILASKLADLGVKDIKIVDTSITDSSYVVSEAFKYSHIVFASTTYNNGIFISMENLLHDIVAHNLQNRKIAIIENGSWAPTSGKLMTDLVSQLKNTEIIGNKLTLKSTIKENQMEEIENLAKAIVETLNK